MQVLFPGRPAGLLCVYLLVAHLFLFWLLDTGVIIPIEIPISIWFAPRDEETNDRWNFFAKKYVHFRVDIYSYTRRAGRERVVSIIWFILSGPSTLLFMFDRSQTELGYRTTWSKRTWKKENSWATETRMFWSSRNLTAADVLPRIGGEKVKKPL